MLPASASLCFLPARAQAKPELRIRSAALCRALFEIFLGEAPAVPEARDAWVKGTKSLLESDTVKRATRKQA